MPVNGRNITTIERSAEGSELHPIQQAYIDNWAFQCGVCTPGRIMGTKTLLDEKPTPIIHEIRIAMDGRLCRCTGYNMIHEAIDDAAERLQARKTTEGVK